jgi:hypothetical protein
VLAGLSSADHTRRLVAAILRVALSSDFKDSNTLQSQFGKTKVFFKQGQVSSGNMLVNSKPLFYRSFFSPAGGFDENEKQGSHLPRLHYPMCMEKISKEKGQENLAHSSW